MTNQPSFPLYSPGKSCATNANFTMLVADLRKDLSVLAIYHAKESQLEIGFEQVYKTAEFESFETLAEQFRGDSGAKFSRVSLGVPGPVVHGCCETTNLPWSVDAEEIRRRIGVEKVHLINDMEATAYSLTDLAKSEMVPIHESGHIHPGNVALLAPGNGLGEAGLFWDGASLHPFATEGGHTEFSPRNEFEVEFYQFLNKIYGIVSWESVLSKHGLYNIYRYLRDVGRHQESPEMAAAVQEGDFLSALCKGAKTLDSRLAKLTLEMFAEFLAREANCLVLKLKATGGIIITGEICEVIREFINKDKFYSDFKISDKMEFLLRDIPIYFVFNSKSILQGAAYFGAFIEEKNLD